MLLLSALWSLYIAAVPNKLPPPTWDHFGTAVTMSEPDVKFRTGVLEGSQYGPEKRRGRSSLAAIAIFTCLDYNGPLPRWANSTADHVFPILNRTCVAVKLAGDVGSQATGG